MTPTARLRGGALRMGTSWTIGRTHSAKTSSALASHTLSRARASKRALEISNHPRRASTIAPCRRRSRARSTPWRSRPRPRGGVSRAMGWRRALAPCGSTTQTRPITITRRSRRRRCGTHETKDPRPPRDVAQLQYEERGAFGLYVGLRGGQPSSSACLDQP